MRLNKLLLLGCLPFFFASCSEESSVVDPQEELGEKVYIALSIENRAIKKKSHQFANKLMALASKENENTFISPLNLLASMGALSNGANEQTYDETMAALGLQEHSLGALNHYHKTIMNGILTEEDPNVEHFAINAMAIDQSLKYKTAFSDKTIEYNILQYFHYGKANFMYNLDYDIKAHDGWIAQETQGMITKLQLPIDASTKAFLYNACCFKGKWASSFDQQNTVEASFTTESGTTQMVPMMHGTLKDVSYTETDDYQFASLDFGNGSFNLALALPKEGKSVADIMSTVDWDTSNTDLYDVKLALPKFKLETIVHLNEILQNIGIKEAFKENAFSGIADGCHFTHMQQNLYFEIDESGVKEATQPSGTPDISMSLNRPFLFAIRENSTNTLMFTGKIAKIE